MDDARDHISQHVAEISSRTRAEADELLAAMVRRCWAASGADRTQPEALEWVRRWGPARLGPRALDCSCERGRCRVCN